MSEIQQLSASIVNKIAAGEVIERPASVVKELMENALDAGSTRVDVAIEKGGGDLVRVADNGSGISSDQLILAVASHATSKIHTADDLFSIGTLGFRGEALASIAEVSRMRLRSRTHDALEATELEIIGGQLRDVVPCAGASGTTIEVRDLFYNTPVRRKFLRTTQTEVGHSTEAFIRLALAHPHVHLTLRHNDRPLYDFTPSDDWRDRIARIFGQDLADGLIRVESHEGDVRLSGYVANPSHSRGNNRWQYLLLNGRPIRDRALQHALSEAYRGLLLTGRYPICFLRLEMPARAVDVNVHPTKLEVRFENAGGLYSQLLGTLRTTFLTTDLTARLQVGGAEGAIHANDPGHAAEASSKLVDWAKEELAKRTADLGGAATGESSAADGSGRASETERPLSLNRIEPQPFKPFPSEGFSSGRVPGEPSLPSAGSPAGEPGLRDFSTGRSTPAMQIHDRYLITESEDGVIVIDQHALHERILYEQIKEKVLSGVLESQTLLVPEPVDLSPAEAAAVLEEQELLAQLGIRVEGFGGETVLVSSYPAMLSGASPADVLREVAERLLTEGKRPERRDLVDELLHMISCKAAIKAGDHLSPAEIEALVEQRHLARDSHHCPHGRPTALIFTRDELDRQFKRI